MRASFGLCSTDLIDALFDAHAIERYQPVDTLPSWIAPVSRLARAMLAVVKKEYDRLLPRVFTPARVEAALS